MLGLLTATALILANTKDLFASAMLTGIYSLLSAIFFVVMDAVDVAFTEASVGAGISTLLMLSTLQLTGQFEKYDGHYSKRALLIVVITGGLLIYGTSDMPLYGDPSAPVHEHVAPRYLNESIEEVGMPNIVTSVLASYRGFDTFGETVVIFTAGIGVIALLGFVRSRDKDVQVKTHAPMDHHRILRIISKILMPLILLFALYVQFHGDYGPGGGFQAGVIFAAAIILYAMLFGLETARTVINQSLVRFLSALGVLIYGTVGVISFLDGKNFLDYSALSEDALHGQHWGILLVELGVGITVASVMMIIFFTFAGRIEKYKGEDQ